jgi:GYF domain 2
MIDSDNWYYHEEGQALGPFSHQVMESRFNQGAFLPETLLWNPLQDQWQPLSTLQPPWSQSVSSPIFQPGPLRIPMSPSPNAQDASSAETAPMARPTLKPLAGSDTSASSKPGFFKRLFARKP